MFLDTPSVEILDQLVWTYQSAVEGRESPASALELVIEQLLEIPGEEAKAISVIALYPMVLRELQQMLQPEYLTELTQSDSDVPTTPRNHGVPHRHLDSLSLEELQECADEAERDSDYQRLAEIQSRIIALAL